MSRIPRQDSEGSLHHVMNRAVGRRTLFEGEADIRDFLSCVGRSVRRGEIRVHAFSFLTTHFHLLVESVIGKLGHAFRCIEGEYVRHFNRRSDRDGPLVRGRFFSKLVTHTAYWARLIRYIDDNPIAAGLVSRAADYPHGSAACYALPAGPHWLERKPIEKYVCAIRGVQDYEPRDYPLVFRSGVSRSERDWIQARIERGDRHGDSFADLITAAPAAVREFLTQRTMLADGTRPGVPMLDIESIRTAIAQEASRAGPWAIGSSRRARCGWDVLSVGLLRTLSAEGLESIALRMQRPIATVRTYLKAHETLLHEDEVYGARALDVARAAVQAFSLGLGEIDASRLPDIRVLLARA